MRGKIVVHIERGTRRVGTIDRSVIDPTRCITLLSLQGFDAGSGEYLLEHKYLDRHLAFWFQERYFQLFVFVIVA